jgi:hypothetical protein
MTANSQVDAVRAVPSAKPATGVVLAPARAQSVKNAIRADRSASLPRRVLRAAAKRPAMLAAPVTEVARGARLALQCGTRRPGGAGRGRTGRGTSVRLVGGTAGRVRMRSKGVLPVEAHRQSQVDLRRTSKPRRRVGAETRQPNTKTT